MMPYMLTIARKVTGLTAVVEIIFPPLLAMAWAFFFWVSNGLVDNAVSLQPSVTVSIPS